ncbi:MAG: uncharacterized membrane protein YebE (DUF533 family) [Verrucomicrobiales bacterium]|jgi:uncharacterized membrane protein YebE (DUF533 family)
MLEDVAVWHPPQELAAEIYSASLAAFDADSPAENVYLARLARQLKPSRRTWRNASEVAANPAKRVNMVSKNE